MAYGNYNNGGYQRQGGYQQQNGGGYQRSGGYSRPAAEPKPQQTAEQFMNERLDVYEQFVNIIKERGHDPADFAFGLTGWVTSFMLQNK